MEMFNSTIKKFGDGEIDLEETCSLLEFWAESKQDDENALNHAATLLSELYDNHTIGESVHRRFLSALNMRANDDDEDETVIVEPLEIDEDEEATILASHDDATIAISSQDNPVDAGDSKQPSKLQPGSILKDRFNLVSVLGEGGMGMVYKAIDMLKVEAKDMNPYVAIKVLTDEFKEHPDAFIALQRETSKAQKLAHPNISTVYDFDRDRESDTIYMTMELLEGKPLNEFIKSMPKDGLPEEDALEIINGLGAGLAYAHEQGLVHSDFKPGNAFVLYDGPVKVIDFGIARAAASTSDKPAASSDDEDITNINLDYISDTDNTNTTDPTGPTGTTYATEDYDAGTLGALTPAYATVEMFEGKEPHPSDDIYALACVAVQLLTGKHPYKKKPAPKAMKLKMAPPAIEGLTKRQQRALDKALAFKREDRTQTMDEFLDGIRRRKNYTKQIAFGTLAAIALIGGLGYKPVINYYEQKEIDEIIERTNQGSQVYLTQTLDSLANYSPQKQTAIKTGIKEKAIDMYTRKIQDSVNVERGNFEFVLANEYINQALSYYPDSAVIKDIQTTVMKSREQVVASLHDELIKHLLAKNLLPDDTKDDLTDTLTLLFKIAPEDDYFQDPRLEMAYFSESQKAMAKSDFKQAKSLISTGKHYISDSDIFQNQLDAITINKIKDAILQMQRSYEEQLAKLGGEIEYIKYLNELIALSITSSHKSKFYNNFLKYFENTFSKNEEININVTTKILETYAPALPISKIINYNNRLKSEEQTSNKTISIPTIHFIDENISVDQYIEHLKTIRQAVFTYKNNVLTQYNIDFEPGIKSLVAEKRPGLITYYKNYYAAVLIPETTSTIDEQIITAQNGFDTNLNELTHRASTENDKRIFRNLASDNRLNDSLIVYDKITKNSNDMEFIEYARIELSRMYATLAESNATEGDFSTALDYVIKAKEFGATERMDKQEYNYRKEIALEEVVSLITAKDEETEKLLLNEENRQSAFKILASLRKNHEDDYPFIINKIADKVNIEVIALATNELIKAHKLKEYALSVVNSRKISTVPIKALPKPSQLALRGKVEASQLNLSAAKATLKEAQESQPDHYQVHELEELLDEKTAEANQYYKTYKKHFDNEKYKLADAVLNDALSHWKDNPVYLQERDFLNRALVQHKAGGKLCRNDMRGAGKQSRGVCKDIILSLKKPAPSMVVVPGMSRDSKPYAIGKYELSMAQLNEFCKVSSSCTPIPTKNGELPALNVPAKIIEEYTQWLSRETGFNYQIAQLGQWLNAASAGGREGNSNYNCRLRLGTKLIKGQNIVPVTSGSANNWGLINYVGNADEVVATDDGYLLAGGNFTDSISDCKISLKKQLSASANTTGYRLVRLLY